MDHDIYLMFDSQMGCSKEQKEPLLRNQIPGTHGDPYDISFIPGTENRKSERILYKEIWVYNSLLFLCMFGFFLYVMYRLIQYGNLSMSDYHLIIFAVLICQLMSLILRIVEDYHKK